MNMAKTITQPDLPTASGIASWCGANRDDRFIVDGVQRMLDRLIGPFKQWVNDLQSGMYINCVYCGHRYGPESEVPASMADVLKRHIAQCPQHPMSKMVTTLKAASHCLRSYQYGNSATELAKEMADSIDQIVAEVEGLSQGKQA